MCNPVVSHATHDHPSSVHRNSKKMNGFEDALFNQNKKNGKYKQLEKLSSDVHDSPQHIFSKNRKINSHKKSQYSSKYSRKDLNNISSHSTHSSNSDHTNYKPLSQLGSSKSEILVNPYSFIHKQSDLNENRSDLGMGYENGSEYKDYEDSPKYSSSPQSDNECDNGIPKVSSLKVKDESGLTRVVTLTADKIRSLYHLPQPQAAKVLGIGLSTLKKHARILLPNERWPNPKQRGKSCDYDDYKYGTQNTELSEISSSTESSPRQQWEDEETSKMNYWIQDNKKTMKRDREYDDSWNLISDLKRQRIDSFEDKIHTYPAESIPPKLRMKYHESFHHSYSPYINNSYYENKGIYSPILSNKDQARPFPKLPEKRNLNETSKLDSSSESSNHTNLSSFSCQDGSRMNAQHSCQSLPNLPVPIDAQSQSQHSAYLSNNLKSFQDPQNPQSVQTYQYLQNLSSFQESNSKQNFPQSTQDLNNNKEQVYTNNINPLGTQLNDIQRYETNYTNGQNMHAEINNPLNNEIQASTFEMNDHSLNSSSNNKYISNSLNHESYNAMSQEIPHVYYQSNHTSPNSYPIDSESISSKQSINSNDFNSPNRNRLNVLNLLNNRESDTKNIESFLQEYRTGNAIATVI